GTLSGPIMDPRYLTQKFTFNIKFVKQGTRELLNRTAPFVISFINKILLPSVISGGKDSEILGNFSSTTAKPTTSVTTFTNVPTNESTKEYFQTTTAQFNQTWSPKTTLTTSEISDSENSKIFENFLTTTAKPTTSETTFMYESTTESMESTET